MISCSFTRDMADTVNTYIGIKCPSCDCSPEDLGHVLFCCPKFAEKMKRLEQTLGKTALLETLVGKILPRQGNWNGVNHKVGRVQCWWKVLLVVKSPMRLNIRGCACIF